MPLLTRMLDESYKSFVRPAILNIIRELMVQTGINPNTPIYYPGSHEALIQQGSALNAKSKNSATGRGPLWRIEVKIERPDETTHMISPNYTNNVAIFKDEPLDIVIWPIYDQVKVSIDVTARFADETSANKWRDDIRTHSSILREENIHTATYHWGIPRSFLVILYQIFACRDRVASYGDTRAEWLLSCFSPKVKTIMNQAKQHHHLVVAETAAGIPGYFDFAGNPSDPQFERTKGYWEYSFTYNVDLSMPIGAVMRYPLVVHNQVLSSKFRDSETPFSLTKKFLTPGAVKANLDNMERVRNPYENRLGGISIPKFDDWLPKKMPGFTGPLFRVMLITDTDSTVDVISLANFDQYFKIDEDLLDLLRERPSAAIVPDESILLATVYAGNIQMDDTQLTIDNNLMIRTTQPMDLRVSYHLLISLVTDVCALSDRARRDLMDNGAVALKYFKSLAPELENSELWPELTPRGEIEKWQFDRVMAYLDRARSRRYIHGDISNRTIGNLIIQSTRKGDL